MEAESVQSLTPLLHAADQWGEVVLLLPLLVALEAVLSADNAIALAAISRRLHDPVRQRQALNLGLLLALVFRLLLIALARWVLDFWPLELAASAYLLWLCGRHLLGADDDTEDDDAEEDDAESGTNAETAADTRADTQAAQEPVLGAVAAAPVAAASAPAVAAASAMAASTQAAVAAPAAASPAVAAPAAAPSAVAASAAPAPAAAGAPPAHPQGHHHSHPQGHHHGGSLGAVVATLAFTDLAFSLDSVAAAVAVTDRLPLVMAGGVIGVIALRLTAELFIRWLELYQHLETAGYLAVGLVGLRLLLRLLLPAVVIPEWALLLSVIALFLWGFSARTPGARADDAAAP